MSRLLVLACFAAVFVQVLGSTALAAPPPPKERKVEKDQDLIQGTWKVAKLEHNGKSNTGPFREGIWVFKDKDVTLLDEKGKERFKATFVLDSDQKPKTIDLTWSDGPRKGQTEKGIFKIEKDTLTLCRGTDERPKEFDGTGKPILLTLEKRNN